jgi:hypothetical protein
MTPPAPTTPCGPRDREWEDWFGSVFGHDIDVIKDGPDPRHLTNLSATDRRRAVIMLRRGLSACEVFAAQAIQRAAWRELVPDLEQASAAEDDDFRVRVIVALRSLGGERDHTDQLIAALGSSSEQARMSAAIGARYFPLGRMRAPLLDRVRLDRGSLVRHPAAESLLDLADIYPRALSEHPAIFKPLTPRKLDKPLLSSLLGVEPAPTPEEQAGFAEAAARLDAAITERLAAGPCAKATPFDSVPLYILPVKADDHVAAITVEHSVGPCERTLDFVVFVRAAAGLGRWFKSATIGRDPVKMSLEMLRSQLPVEYHRAAHSLTVGGLALDTSKVNVAVVSAGNQGVAAQYQAKENLTFERHGHPPPDSSFNGLAPARELADEIGTLVNHSPALKALIGSATPSP